MNPTQYPIQTPPQTPPEVFVQQPKPNYLKIIIFSVLIVMTLGLITYLLLQNQKLQKQITDQRVVPTIELPFPTQKKGASVSIAPDETAGWKKYINKQYGFSFNYPPNWPVPNDTAEPANINTSESQGKINIYLRDSFGGACPPSYEKIIIDGKTFSVCHLTEHDGTESWSQIVKEFAKPINNYLGLEIYAYSQAPTKINRETILKILSTFKFISAN